MQVINRQPVEGSFGESFERNLRQVLNYKMQDLMQKHQTKQISQRFENLNYTPEQSQVLSLIAEKNPRYLTHVMSSYRPDGKEGVNPLQNVLAKPGTAKEVSPNALLGNLTGRLNKVVPKDNDFRSPLNEFGFQLYERNISRGVPPAKAIGNTVSAVQKRAFQSEKLIKQGFKPEDLSIVLGAPELNDEVVDILLKYSGNDPKKARALAKQLDIEG